MKTCSYLSALRSFNKNLGIIFDKLRASKFTTMAMLYFLITTFILNLNLANEVPYAAVETAFASGDANKIVALSSDKVLLNVVDREGVYAHAQASQILKDFFSKKPVSSFKFTYKNGTGTAANAIGTYTSKGENYRVTVKWAKDGADFKIESISITKT